MTRTTHKGVPAYVVPSGVSGEQMVVAAEPPHRPLAFRGTEGGLDYAMELTQWDAVPAPVIPPRR